MSPIKRLFPRRRVLPVAPPQQEPAPDPAEAYVESLRGGRPLPTWFDGGYYLHANLDVSSLKLDPYQHYIEHGHGEGRPPNEVAGRLGRGLRPPLRLGKEDRDRQVGIVLSCGVFDADWYAEQYHVPREHGPLDYIVVGAFLGRNPNPFFSSLGYFDRNRDAASIGANPLVHYLEEGYAQGRPLNTSDVFDGRLTAKVWQKGL